MINIDIGNSQMYNKDINFIGVFYMKRTLSALLAALLLTGCTDSVESNISEGAAQTTEQSASAVQSTTDATSAEPVDTVTPPTEKDRLLQLIRDDIIADDPNASPNLAVIFFEDFYGDGTKDLIAADGGMEIHDGEAFYYGDLWQVTKGENYAHRMRADDGSCAMTSFKRLSAGDDELISFELYSETSEYNTTELWAHNKSWFSRVLVDGTAQLEITQTDDCEFTAFSTGYGASTDGTGRIYLPYELHYNSSRNYMEPYLLREITFDELNGYGQSFLDMIASDGGKVTSCYLSENDTLVINYTVGEQLRYVLCKLENDTLCVDMDDGNLGNYPVDITFEQQRLERLILDSIPEEDKKEGLTHSVVATHFADIDGDGAEDLLAAVSWAEHEYSGYGDIWFASGDTAVYLEACAFSDYFRHTPDGTFLRLTVPGPYHPSDAWVHIHNSTAVNAMPEGYYSLDCMYYSESDGYYYGFSNSALYLSDMGIEPRSYKHRMTFDKESRRLVIAETTAQ